MPTPSQPGSRRSSTKPARPPAKLPAKGPVKGARPVADFSEGASRPQTAPKTGVKRSAARKSAPKMAAKSLPQIKPHNRKGWLIALVTACASVVLLGATTGVLAAYRETEGRVHYKQAVLGDLEKQLAVGKHRLASLTSARGREQLLVENGYLKPGDRLLLFPRTEAEKKAAQVSKNDLVPHPPLESDGDGSTWARSGKALRGWWRGLTGQNAPAAHHKS